MKTASYRRWFDHRIRLAESLVSDQECNAEPDAEILLCCAASALAAIMWPGFRLDRQRFTQFLVDFAPDSSAVQQISIPLLVAQRRAANDANSAQILRDKFYPSSGKVVVGSEIDQPETAVRKLLPSLPLCSVRKASYAGIIYTDLRCGLVHEYKLSADLTAVPMSSRTDEPSYSNILLAPDEVVVERVMKQFGISRASAQYAVAKTVRHLHFPFDYLCTMARGVADAAFGFWDTASSWDQPCPSSWWISG